MVVGGRAGGGAEREPAPRAREHRGPVQTLQATQAHQAYTTPNASPGYCSNRGRKISLKKNCIQKKTFNRKQSPSSLEGFWVSTSNKRLENSTYVYHAKTLILITYSVTIL